MFGNKRINSKGPKKVEIACNATINKEGFGFNLLGVKAIIASFGKTVTIIPCKRIHVLSYYPTNKTCINTLINSYELFSVLLDGMCIKIERPAGGLYDRYILRSDNCDFEMIIISENGSLELSKFSNELTEYGYNLAINNARRASV